MWPGGNDSNICTMMMLWDWVVFKLQKPCSWTRISSNEGPWAKLGLACHRVMGVWNRFCRFACGNIKRHGILRKCRKRESDWNLPRSLEILAGWSLHPSEPLAVRKQPQVRFVWHCPVLSTPKSRTVYCDSKLKIKCKREFALNQCFWSLSSLSLLECTLPEIITHFKHREYKFVLHRQELVAGHGDDPGQARKLKDQHLLTYCSKFSIFSWWHSRLKHSNDWSGNILKVKWEVKASNYWSLSSIRMF